LFARLVRPRLVARAILVLSVRDALARVAGACGVAIFALAGRRRRAFRRARLRGLCALRLFRAPLLAFAALAAGLLGAWPGIVALLLCESGQAGGERHAGGQRAVQHAAVGRIVLHVLAPRAGLRDWRGAM